MRLSLRFLVPLLLALALFAWAAVPLTDALMTRWFVRDLEIRSTLVAATIQDSLQTLVQSGSDARVAEFFNKLTRDERLYAVGLCRRPFVGPPISSTNFPAQLSRCENWVGEAGETSTLVRTAYGTLNVSVRPVAFGDAETAKLVLVHDMNFVDRRNEETRRYLFYFFLALGACVALITVVIAQVSWRGWVSGLRALLRGDGIVRRTGTGTAPELRPIARDVSQLLRELEHLYRPTDENQQRWTKETLRATLRGELRGNDIIVASNREPYLHERDGAGVRVRRPASGLVTALEPVMRACSGTWIAHGSGSADRETVDRNDRVRVPPDSPSYTLRRVWLSEEEEQGYYYGFANEGLWPLCHIAHVRPVFRSSDWEQYVRVNRRFADVVCEEARTEDPVVLVQDYHFALLPRMIRERLPGATIITFWHIPWPNPESFGICPWREELIAGLLGSTILGFHTRFHCQNFVETVDRFMEARIERESSTISYGGDLTRVEPYPISIQWPPEWADNQLPVALCRAKVLRVEQLADDVLLGVGVDRMDYTKGIVERFLAVERLLEQHPDFIGRFVFVQIAAPSRSALEEYQHFEARVRTLAARINARFGRNGYQPIHLKVEHHPPQIVNEYYRAANVCVVTSLHDGMNLVAKEFIASRDDEQGVLVLSQFTGAARELHDALLVNPYHGEQCAEELYRALTMPADEQRVRMRSMRRLVQEFNVYRWAGAMLLDAARLRQRRRVSQRIVEHQREATPLPE